MADDEEIIMGNKAKGAFYTYLSKTDDNLFAQLLRSDTVVMLPQENYGLLTVIAVDEMTTSDEIRDSAPLALQIRDKVTEWQGYYLPDYAPNMLFMFERDTSYAEIAEYMNERIEFYLTSIISMRNEKPTKDIVVDENLTILGHTQERNEYFAKGLMDEPRQILLALRFNMSTIDDLLNEWLGYLERGEKFFTRDMPIDRDKVIRAMKYWRTKPKPHGTVS